MKHRTGTVLAELVICMSIGSSLMLLAIGVAHQALSASSRARQRCDVNRACIRLERQFRNDVHRAAKLTSVAAESLQIELDDSTNVTYEVKDNSVVRVQSTATKADASVSDAVRATDADVTAVDQKVVDPTTSSAGERERYVVGENRSIVFGQLEDPPRAALTIRHNLELQNIAPRIELYVVAVVSKLNEAEQVRGDQ